jgi:uncharacterized protein (DUF2062 family)
MNGPVAAADSPASPGSIWERRVMTPIVRQLRQGVTPDAVALTVALGLAIGVFPIIGATTLLCGAVAVGLRLNQPIIQLVNYFAYPLQLTLLIPFYRAGEWLFAQPHMSLSIPMLIARFRAGAWTFLGDFGRIGAQGIVVWCLVAPVIAAGVYFMIRPSLRALARRVAGRSAEGR